MFEWYEIATFSCFLVALFWVILDDDSKSIEEYIRNHPEEFRRD